MRWDVSPSSTDHQGHQLLLLSQNEQHQHHELKPFVEQRDSYWTSSVTGKPERGWHIQDHCGAKVPVPFRRTGQQNRLGCWASINDNQDMHWKVAEECYKQAYSSDGVLNGSHFFAIGRKGSNLAWPYDVSQLQHYYISQERFMKDRNYATYFRRRQGESDRKKLQMWNGFGVKALNNVPGGQMLYYLSSGKAFRSLEIEAVPHYLFRILGNESAGRNDESVIASKASKMGSPETQINLLTLKKHKAAEMLNKHLNGEIFFAKEHSNLVSWISSLMYAIRYAPERHRERRFLSRSINICAVDTTKFAQVNLRGMIGVLGVVQ